MTNSDRNLRASIEKARNGILAMFFANGLVISSWLSRLPDVKQQLELSAGELSILLLAIAVGALLGMPLASRLTNRLGPKSTALIGASVSLSGMLLTVITVQINASHFVPMFGLFVFGLGAGVWDVVQNLEGSVVEQKLGKSIMPRFHAAFSGGTVVGALIGVAATQSNFPIAIHVSSAVFVTAFLVIWGTSRYLPSPKVDEHEDSAKSKQRSAWAEPRTLLIGLIALAAAFIEGAAGDWTAIAFVEGHGTSTAMGVFAMAVFLAFMTSGRVFGTKALDKFGRVPVLRVIFISSIFGCLLVVFGNEVGAFIGAALWGLGASLGFPVGISAASDDPKRAAQRIGVVSTIAYSAFLAGPPLIGFLGDAVGILKALLVVGATSAIAFLLVPAARSIR